MQSPGELEPDAIAKAIGEPNDVVILIVGSLGTGLAAWATYYWRCRATSAEKAVSRAAIRQPRTWVESLGVGLGMMVVSSGLSWLLDQAGHQAEPTNLVMLEQALAFSPWLLILVAVVLAPLSEELLFRRVLFGRFWAAGRPMTGLVASSLLFALMHEIPGTTPSPLGITLILLVFYALMGAAFAWIYKRTGTLWAPILAHATNNLLGCLALIAGYGS